MKSRFFAALASAACAAIATNAPATTLPQLSLQDIVDQSQIVVIGEVVDNSTKNTDDGVFTYTKVRIEDRVIGPSRGDLVVVTPGGSIQPGKFRVNEVVPGAPVFFKGQEALLFLTDGPSAGTYSVVGLTQGAARVVDTPQGKKVRLPDGDGREMSLGEAKDHILDMRASPRRGDVE